MYKLNLKPWRYYGVRYEEYFWKFAIKTPFYNQLLSMRENFSDEDAKNDKIAFEKLQSTAIKYILGTDNYKTFKVNS